MAEQFEQRESLALMHQMGLNSGAIERRREIVGLAAADLARIATIKDLVLRRADDYCATFFDSLATFAEARPLLHNTALFDRARRLKLDHLRASRTPSVRRDSKS